MTPDLRRHGSVVELSVRLLRFGFGLLGEPCVWQAPSAPPPTSEDADAAPSESGGFEASASTYPPGRQKLYTHYPTKQAQYGSLVLTAVRRFFRRLRVPSSVSTLLFGLDAQTLSCDKSAYTKTTHIAAQQVRRTEAPYMIGKPTCKDFSKLGNREVWTAGKPATHTLSCKQGTGTMASFVKLSHPLHATVL